MRKPKIKILQKVVNDHAFVNDTFLSPYVGYNATVFLYKNRRIDLLIDGFRFDNVQGEYCSEYNGWRYKIMMLLSPIGTKGEYMN